MARNQLAGYHRTSAVELRARRRLGIERLALDDDEYERVERLASLAVDTRGLAALRDRLGGTT